MAVGLGARSSLISPLIAEILPEKFEIGVARHKLKTQSKFKTLCKTTIVTANSGVEIQALFFVIGTSLLVRKLALTAFLQFYQC
jgi:hypothetical protein